MQPHARFRLRILRRTRSNAGRTSAGSLSGRIESIWETPSKERGTQNGACLESGRNTERACNTAARSCPSSLSKFPGRTWASGSARGKHVIKLVQVPCPSSCPSSGFRLGHEVGIGACLESGRNTERACNTAARSCPSSLSKFPGRTWTSGSARGKHVIKFVQVPCPSSCPSSGSRGAAHGIGACLESGRNLRELVTRQPAVVQVPCPSSPAELGQGTSTTAGCLVIVCVGPGGRGRLESDNCRLPCCYIPGASLA